MHIQSYSFKTHFNVLSSKPWSYNLLIFVLLYTYTFESATTVFLCPSNRVFLQQSSVYTTFPKIWPVTVFAKWESFISVEVLRQVCALRCSVMYSVCLSSFSCSAVLTVLSLMLTTVSYLQLEVRLTSCGLTIHVQSDTCLHHCVLFTTHISILYCAGNAV